MRALVIGLLLSLFAGASHALIISEYVEGTQNNQAIELFQPGPGSLVLDDGVNPPWTLQLYMNGSPVPTITIALSGTILPNDVFVIANSLADPAVLAAADQLSPNLVFNGDDAVVLVDPFGNPVDRVGQVGVDPGGQWGAGLTSTRNNTLQRVVPAVGDPNITAPFDPSVGWTGFANNTFTGLGTVPDPGALPMLLVGLIGLAAMSSRGPGARRPRRWRPPTTSQGS